VSVVGVIGGGQLARMMIPAAVNLGLDIAVFAETDNSSARIGATYAGDYTDLSQLLSFAATVDVVTFDHEHVPVAHLEALQAQGTPVFPPPRALALTHNKIVMRRALAEIGVPQPRWSVATQATRDEALGEVGGFPFIAKLPVGGYDGKGVRLVTQWEDLDDWWSTGEVLFEEAVDFTREIAQLSARRPSGHWVPWAAVETRQEGGVCATVLCPAPGFSQAAHDKARDIARRIAEAYEVVGVLAVELFETREGGLLVNELAMRPHNSGHVLTEQAITSQFEQHLRAVADYPLGSTELQRPAGVMVNVFGDASITRYRDAAEEFPEVKFHSYQKAPRPGRKAGHLVATGDDMDTVFDTAVSAWSMVEHGKA
jgi:5-(carboxyamino)imidazole ribonucleotide synthase